MSAITSQVTANKSGSSVCEAHEFYWWTHYWDVMSIFAQHSVNLGGDDLSVP